MAYFQIKSPSLKANIILAFILLHPPQIPKYCLQHKIRNFINQKDQQLFKTTRAEDSKYIKHSEYIILK